MKMFILKNIFFMIISAIIASFFCISLVNFFSKKKDYIPFLRNNFVFEYLRFIGVCKSISSYKLIYNYENKINNHGNIYLKISNNTYIVYKTEYKGLIWGNIYSPNTKGQPVMKIIFNRTLKTLKFSIPGAASSYLISILFIILWTLFIKNKILNNILEYTMILIYSFPRDLIIMLIMAFLCIFNTNGKNPIFGGFAWFFLFFIFNSVIFKQSLEKTLSKNYIKIAKSYGISKFKIIIKHAFIESLIPIITNIRAILVTAFFGASIVETTFGINGIGALTIDAIKKNDTIIYKNLLFIGVFIILIPNLITDIMTYSINLYRDILE